jgi:hypothetical protein
MSGQLGGWLTLEVQDDPWRHVEVDTGDRATHPGSRAGSSVFGRRQFQGVLKPSWGWRPKQGEPRNFLHVRVAEKQNPCYVFLVAGLMSGLLGGLPIEWRKRMRPILRFNGAPEAGEKFFV